MGLREDMPEVTAFVDAMRAAFGREEVNGWLLGRDGAAFWARENGHEWGERPDLGSQAMSAHAYARLGLGADPADNARAPDNHGAKAAR